VALEAVKGGGKSLSVISLCPMTSLNSASLTRLSSRRYRLIQYNPVALTCTSVTQANGVVTDLNCCTYIHALEYLRYTTYIYTWHRSGFWFL
jgi:hypothetical protein